MAHHSIGVLSKKTGCNVETIRYYEREGLWTLPARTAGGHRVYDDEHVKRLSFVRRSRELGFTLDEIRGLLALVDKADFTCDEVQTLTLDHAGQIRRKIEDLTKIEHVLRDMAAKCDRGAVPECPVIDTLFGSATARD